MSNSVLLPAEIAADLRLRAKSASGPERTYLLWLAAAWEKSGDRSDPDPTAPGGRRWPWPQKDVDPV